MKTFQRQKRTITWILLVSFLMLVNLQAIPMERRYHEESKNYFTSGSEGMGLVEKGESGNEIKKKKRFPWLLIVAGSVVAGAALYFLVIKKAAEKIGTYNNIKVGFKVQFRGCNTRTRYAVLVDGISKMNEILVFDVPSSTNPATWKTIERSFWIEKSKLENILIQLEIGPETEFINPAEGMGHYAVHFDLEVLSYSYSGGKDPGQPILSESSFSIPCEWKYNQKVGAEKTITLTAPNV